MGEDEQQILHPVQVDIVIDPVDIRSVSAEEKQTTLVRIFCFSPFYLYPPTQPTSLTSNKSRPVFVDSFSTRHSKSSSLLG